MKRIASIGAAVLTLTLGVAVSFYAQEQHGQQEEKKDQPTEHKEKTQPAKPAKQEQKAGPQQHSNATQKEETATQRNNNAKQQKTATHEQTAHKQQHQSQAKPAQQAKRGGGRIPDDRYRAHFGQDHRFRVTQSNYSRDHRFQYGGYSFGFVDPWPSNWLYTQDVYVVDIDGIYYLCNPMYPGVHIALSMTL